MTGLGQHGPDGVTGPGQPPESPASPEGTAGRAPPRPARDRPGDDTSGQGGPARPAATRWPRSAETGDGALRGLVDGGRSKISLSSAMRARDVARPDADDLAEADRLIAERIAADRARAARPPGRRAPAMWKRAPLPAPPPGPADETGQGRA
ncbi:hypothetical protein [Pseudofrankia sp. DC12]|uniref:hypothetical protein n=1 Tax=Pseudofrankia sp. DC12 TaxID=683315 RepID=UPI0006986A1C|nr:hypothetical protein [Pseudofrankia sp. DC12]